MFEEKALTELQKLTDEYYICLNRIQVWSEKNLSLKLEKAKTIKDVEDIFSPIHLAVAGMDERGERVIIRELPGDMHVEKMLKINTIQFTKFKE